MLPRAVFYAEIIRCGLQDRVIGGLVDLDERSWRIVFLQSGEVAVHHEQRTETMAAPALVWLPITEQSRVTARAGTIGAHLLLGERGLSNAIGRKPEAAELRMMARERVMLSLAENPQTLVDVARAFDLALREGQAVAPGSETIIEAQVRVLLVLLWRHAMDADQLAMAEALPSQILQRFRQVLEVKFRERWGVGDYSRELGMSPDRLHDICTRTIGKPPLRLIHERTVYEAQSLLERSSRTVDQIADFLGFGSAPQFSKFFKSVVGVPPGQYRRQLRNRHAEDSARQSPSLADWP